MRTSIRKTVGLAALLLAALAASARAQESGKRDRDTGGSDHDTRMLINHGLDMLIDGGNMQLTAREVVSRAAAETGRAPAQPGATSIQQLQEEARQDMESGNRMIADARNALRDRNSDDARLCEAAERFSTTLRTLASQNLASPVPAQPARVANPNQPQINPARPALAPVANGLSSADVASIALIDEAVKEAIDACNLKHFTSTSGSGSSGSEKLQEHARKMATHSEQCLQRMEASLSPRSNPNEIPRANPPRTGRAPAAQPGADPTAQPQQPATVQTLAHQARELVQLITEGKGSNEQPSDRNEKTRK